MSGILRKVLTADIIASDENERSLLFEASFSDQYLVPVSQIPKELADAGLIILYLIDRLANLEGEDRATIWRQIAADLPAEPPESTEGE